MLQSVCELGTASYLHECATYITIISLPEMMLLLLRHQLLALYCAVVNGLEYYNNYNSCIMLFNTWIAILIIVPRARLETSRGKKIYLQAPLKLPN